MGQVPLLRYVICFISEFLGTALLVFLGCLGCIESAEEHTPSSYVQACFNFGVIVLILIQCFLCVSGTHINPVITIAATIYKLLPWQLVPVYFLAQVTGAICGYGTLKIVLPASAVEAPGGAHNLCITAPSPHIHPYQGALIEFIITSVLVLSVVSCWDHRNPTHMDTIAFRVGFTISGLAIAAGSFTGASLNPARTLGPAIWNNDYHHHWIYWAGPLPAAPIVTIGYKYFFGREEDDTEKDKNN